MFREISTFFLNNTHWYISVLQINLSKLHLSNIPKEDVSDFRVSTRDFKVFL